MSLVRRTCVQLCLPTAELRAVKEQLEGAQRKCGVLEEQLQHLQEANAAMIQERKVWMGAAGCMAL